MELREKKYNVLIVILFSILYILLQSCQQIVGNEDLTNKKDVLIVNFETNGGSAVKSQFVKQGELIQYPLQIPTKDGYPFLGWCNDSTLLSEWDFETDIVVNDTTLYAKWEESSSSEKMVLIFDLNAPEASNAVILPFGGNYNDSFDIHIDWGDGYESDHVQSYSDIYHQDVGHMYYNRGIYVVKITGYARSFGRDSYYLNTPDTLMPSLVKVKSFGNLGITNLAYAFNRAINLIEVPENLPSTVTNLQYMFNEARKFNQDLNSWNTSNVTDMAYMFQKSSAFNGCIKDWNTSNVTRMTGMFKDAESFNQETGQWNTQNVTSMLGMFYAATAFNQNIGKWNTQNVTNTINMFRDAKSFNQDIGRWNTSNITSMSHMFSDAKSFNQNIGKWNTSNVTSMRRMFGGAESFNQDIGLWNTQNVTTMNCMFYGAKTFNQNLSNWNVNKVTNNINFSTNASAWDSSFKPKF